MMINYTHMKGDSNLYSSSNDAQDIWYDNQDEPQIYKQFLVF